MKKWEIIGFSSRKGEYEGKSYDNILVHCVREASEDYETGSVCTTFKVRRSDLVDHMPSVGDIVTPYYDQYGRVVALV